MLKESYNKEKLRAHQLKLLEVLSYLIETCEQHNLTYFLVGGSVLGSVRHAGFIPWDDDIDIALPRKQFDLLDKILASTKHPEFTYLTADTPTSPHPPFGVLSYSAAPGIDIYPLDGVPSSKILQSLQKYAADFYHLAVYKQVPVNRGKFAALVVKFLLNYTPNFLITFLGKAGKFITTFWDYENSRYIANIFGLAGYRKEIMPREYLGKGTFTQFESKEYRVPEKHDLYLKHLYKDYLRLPPIEKQYPSHGDFL